MIELRKLTINDGTDVFEMVQEIGKGENGFTNSLYSEEFSIFQEKLLRNYEMSEGINLKPQFVPQTIYWLYVNGKPVGYGKLRHYLNQHLLQHGGHIGYAIRPMDRGKGYAKILLKKLVQESKEKRIDQVLLTCYESNKASKKVIEFNGGELRDKKDGDCFYWININ
ncbi:GNAT family N-acetyltransferase [Virgibacillus halodenitrificans]|uniref:GNAT family N-acetyltransferase n=1 Tax=Virgibacillus halodenitrificans TaxID=1482 RepID=UPI000EF548F7|nr:GNAT family N-acetyltransferase [Virgibacillus halodenitrificans]